MGAAFKCGYHQFMIHSEDEYLSSFRWRGMLSVSIILLSSKNYRDFPFDVLSEKLY